MFLGILGISILYPPNENVVAGNRNLGLDIVAVHGLNGDSFRTWTEPKSKKMWLRDFLGEDLKWGRVMTFGYDATAAFGKSMAGIEDHARALLGGLVEKRGSGAESNRPIIFIGHSLGGLVIKQALIIASQESKYSHIYHSTKGIIFFGTPHQGSDLATYATTLVRVPTMLTLNPTPELLSSLRKGSGRLATLTENFKRHHEARPYDIVSFYETRTMKGYPNLVVEKTSALLTPPDEVPVFEDQIPVDAHHRDMCRFASKKDKTYQAAVESIKKIYQGSNVPEVENEFYVVDGRANEHFTGRNDIRTRLSESLIEERWIGSKAQQRFVLYGLGGSGKTQICLKFAEDQREKFWGIFWIDATSKETAEESFLKIARTCRQEENLESIKSWLSGRENWLLVIDNADDPNLDISRFFPNGTHGTIIITSRNPDLQKYGSAGSCRIDEMTPEEAVALFLKTAAVENPQDDSTRKAVGQVVKVLGYFALAIIQAAAVIRQRVCTIDEFCELYATQKKELLESGRSQSNVDYQYSVYTTWEISIKKIQEMSDKHAVLALEILRLISFMHFDGIRKDIFKKAIENPYLPGDWYERGIFRRSILVQMMPSRWDGVMTGRALALLVAFSLITISDKGQISVHPLVHEWSRDRMSETQRWQAWETTVVTLGLANTNETDLEGQQRRKFLLPHIDACLGHDNDRLFVGDGQELAERSYAATTFMTAYNESNRADKSLELGLRDLKSKETQLQPDHYYCSMVKGHMAKNLFDLDRFQEAADIQQDLLTLALEQKSDDRIMTAMVGLAGNYNSLGEHQKAIDTCKDVMSKFRRVFGETERMILVAAEITAMANVAIGRPKEALGFAEKVLESHKQLLGEQHLDTLIAMHNLAKVYEALKQFKKARIYQEQCYGVSKESLGAEHGFTIQQLAKLAGSARREGRTLRTKWDIDYAKETVKVLGSKYGASDSRTLYYMEILGEDYFIYGALADAQLVQMDLVKKLIRTRGKEDKYTISAIESLSQTRKRMRVRHALYWWMPQRRRDRKVVRL